MQKAAGAVGASDSGGVGVSVSMRGRDNKEEEAEVSEGLNKLKHLAHKMRVDAQSFSEQDTLFVHQLVAYLHSLHEECVKLREVFETETINASALRYHLYYLPTQIRREIKASVNAARESNTCRIQSLESTLGDIEVNMTDMKDSLNNVEKENVTLHPERNKLQERHEEVVTHLNQTMQEKASKQILLNDTRDQLREAHQTIADIQDDMEFLEEQLREERRETKRQKKELKKEIEETKESIKEQQSQNESEKDQLDGFRKELEEKRERLQIKTRSTGLIEKNCVQLSAREEALERQLERVRGDNEKKREEISATQRRDFERQAEYTVQREQLELQLKQIQEDSQGSIEENERLKKGNARLHAELKASNEEKKADANAMRSLREQLSEQQAEMGELTEETGRLTAENEDMSSHIQQIQETHDSAMKVKNAEADTLKDKLLDVQNLRKQLQSELDDILRQTDRLKAENARNLSLLNKKIAEGKRQHATLTQEGQQLQSAIRSKEGEIKSSQETLRGDKEKYQKLREKLEKDIHLYESSIDKYTRARDEKRAKVEEETPLFIKLQQDHRDYTQKHEQNKKQLTVLKAQNAKLGNEVSVAKVQLQQLDTPKRQAETGIKETGRETVEELNRQGREKKRVEADIEQVGEKIVCVVDQNDRLKSYLERMGRERGQLTEDIIDSGQKIRQLRNTCIDKRDGLVSGWDQLALQTEGANRKDGVVLGEMGKQERETVERKERVEVVSTQLQTHITNMTLFLTQVTNLRGAVESEQKKNEGKSEDHLQQQSGDDEVNTTTDQDHDESSLNDQAKAEKEKTEEEEGDKKEEEEEKKEEDEEEKKEEEEDEKKEEEEEDKKEQEEDEKKEETEIEIEGEREMSTNESLLRETDPNNTDENLDGITFTAEDMVNLDETEQKTDQILIAD
ncbi:trichohyalin-like [Symsagittifera roscoffensis]|uniref:trichohyalin-like n=1 Tax=Symsagittifera roscoffensis TaxID=84072 RepID=UPI00307C88A5